MPSTKKRSAAQQAYLAGLPVRIPHDKLMALGAVVLERDDKHQPVLVLRYTTGRELRWRYRSAGTCKRALRQIESELRQAQNDAQHDAIIDKYRRIVEDVDAARKKEP